MEGATLTPPRAGADYRARLTGAPWPVIGLVVLSIAALVLFFVYPTYPNYDSYYSLIWGRELLHGQPLSFDVYRAPTEHPAGVFFGAALSVLGRGADRVMIFFSLVSLVVLVAGMYRLAARAFTPLVGLLAALLLLTRFDFPFLAARGYIDVSYLAVVVWAAVIEQERPRQRPVLVLLFLAAAGLMRPEAWIITGLYFLWVAWKASWGQRALYLALAAIGPVVWAGLDWIVTGDPKFSLSHTSGLAEDLGRTEQLSQVPGSMAHFLVNLDKAPVLVAGLVGLALAALITPKRIGVLVALTAIGVGTFMLLGVGGFSVIDRYVLVPSLMFMIFAGVSIGGWTMLKPSVWRTAWIVLAGLAVVGGVAFSVTRLNLNSFRNELVFRNLSHRSLIALADDPAVRAGLKCGPLSTPNHKLVPDTRWVLDAGPTQVVPRSDPRYDPQLRPVNSIPPAPLAYGVTLVTTDRSSLLRNAFTTNLDDPLHAIAQPGYRRVFAGAYYGAYVRCR